MATITKKAIWDAKGYGLSHYQKYVIDWDEVVDYFWSVDLRPLDFSTIVKSEKLLREAQHAYEASLKNKKKRLIWTRDYDEAKKVKATTFMHSHYLTLNIKLADGTVYRFHETDIPEDSEVLMIKMFLQRDAMEKETEERYRADLDDPF